MSTQTDFINKVKDGAIEGQKKYGVYASVTIAQAIYESGWGSSPVSHTDNNLFGIKFYGNHCPDITITRGSISSSSDSDGGSAYARYNSWNDSILDHGYFLAHNSRYKNALAKGVDANEQIQLIMQDGYADTGYSDDAISIMKTYNLYQYDSGKRGSDSTDSQEQNSKIIESAISWAIKIANDDTHGYDQNNRWGPDYDCSSFVITAFEQTGLKLKENGATYTGDMESAFNKCGFKTIKWTHDESILERGDILLNIKDHTALYLGNGKLVQASSNEYGTATGGKTGDQTGKEIWIRDFYDFPWDIVLRLEHSSLGQSSSGQSSSEQSEEVYKKLKTTSYNLNALNDDELNIIKSLSFNDKVKIKQTFYRNKKILGYNNFKQKLTFINYTFILKDVKQNGFFILTVYNTNGHNYFYINPKFIKKVN